MMDEHINNAIQAGDVLMFHGELDCGDIIAFQTAFDPLTSDRMFLIEMTQSFETMAYLCRFGGNQEDDGSPASDKLQWLGNEGEPPERQYRCRTQALLNGTPLTSSSLVLVQDAAKADIEDAFIGGGYAESVETVVSIAAPKMIQIVDKIWLKSGDIYTSRIRVTL